MGIFLCARYPCRQIPTGLGLPYARCVVCFRAKSCKEDGSCHVERATPCTACKRTSRHLYALAAYTGITPSPLGPLGFNFSQHGPTTRPSRRKDRRESVHAFGSRLAPQCTPLPSPPVASSPAFFSCGFSHPRMRCEMARTTSLEHRVTGVTRE